MAGAGAALDAFPAAAALAGMAAAAVALGAFPLLGSGTSGGKSSSAKT